MLVPGIGRGVRYELILLVKLQLQAQPLRQCVVGAQLDVHAVPGREQGQLTAERGVPCPAHRCGIAERQNVAALRPQLVVVRLVAQIQPDPAPKGAVNHHGVAGALRTEIVNVRDAVVIRLKRHPAVTKPSRAAGQPVIAADNAVFNRIGHSTLYPFCCASAYSRASRILARSSPWVAKTVTRSRSHTVPAGSAWIRCR